MKLLILIGFALIALARGRVVEKLCEDVLVHNINHEKEILVNNVDSPYQLALDYDTNMLFFSISSTVTSETFSSAYINLKTNEFQIIKGISGGFANTVDNKKHGVYLGGSDGIYKFNFDTRRAEHIDGTNQSIWQMFFKDDLYYSIYPSEEVYMFKNGRTEIVPELANTKAMLVALNNDKDFYFSNSTGVYKYSRRNAEIRELFSDEYNANSLTADNNGNLYFSTPNGLYYINEKDKVEKLASIPNIYGMAIESDGNIIYASQNSVVRLKPTKTPCYVDEKINNGWNNI